MVVDVSAYNVSGGTIVAAIQLIKDRGVDNKQIKVVGFYYHSYLFNCIFLFFHLLLPGFVLTVCYSMVKVLLIVWRAFVIRCLLMLEWINLENSLIFSLHSLNESVGKILFFKS